MARIPRRDLIGTDDEVGGYHCVQRAMYGATGNPLELRTRFAYRDGTGHQTWAMLINRVYEFAPSPCGGSRKATKNGRKVITSGRFGRGERPVSGDECHQRRRPDHHQRLGPGGLVDGQRREHGLQTLVGHGHHATERPAQCEPRDCFDAKCGFLSNPYLRHNRLARKHLRKHAEMSSDALF